jgi:lipopolysaccharide/colanic/teichoic acid biosynthesis glycosyltransferase
VSILKAAVANVMITKILQSPFVRFLLHLAVIASAVWFAVYLRLNLDVGIPLDPPLNVQVLYVAALIIYPALLLLLSFYDPRRTYRAVDEYQILTVSSIISGVALGFAILFIERELSRLLLVYFFVIEFALMFFVQIALRLMRRKTGGDDVDLSGPSPMNGYQRAIKRSVDVILSLAILTVTLPVMAMIAVLIKLDSSGPVLFRQVRVGEGGRRFGILKFRSMTTDAEDRFGEILKSAENGGIVHKHRDDPRVTRIGSLLRRTSLDELPQLINVLNGDMSLVGPRPELPVFVERYEPWQRERLLVPQGMTGWWQVNGRSDKPLHLNTDHDIYYVRNYSLLLDLQILLKTVWVVMRAKGAF